MKSVCKEAKAILLINLVPLMMLKIISILGNDNYCINSGKVIVSSLLNYKYS